MQEHPSSEQLNLYERRALAPDLFLSIHKHVSACPVCFEQCNASIRIKEDYETLLTALMPDPLDEPYHLTKAEVAGYVKRDLDEVATEAAASHLEVCGACVQAVEETRAAVDSNAIKPTANAISGKEQNYRAKSDAGLIASLRAWGRPIQFASLLLLVLGLILIAVLLMRTRDRQTVQPSKDQSANLNANREAPPSTPQPDQSPTTKNGEQTSPPSGIGPEEQRAAERLASISPSAHEAIISSLTTQRVEKPQFLAELTGTSHTLRGESAEGVPFPLLRPVGQVVRNRNPTFMWKPLTGASRYVVTVADDKMNEVATSEPLTSAQWRVPVPLKWGALYSWQVTAFKDGQEVVSPVMPAPQARFMILDQTRAEELRQVEHAFPNYHLGLGVLYARAGLLDEAEQEFQAELKASPNSAVARKLLESVRSMRK
jgi:hypothetical protein